MQKQEKWRLTYTLDDGEKGLVEYDNTDKGMTDARRAYVNLGAMYPDAPVSVEKVITKTENWTVEFAMAELISPVR